MAEEWARVQPCWDGIGREREAKVFLTEEDRIAVATPPGCVAAFSIVEVPQLQQHIAAALLEATHRGAAGEGALEFQRPHRVTDTITGTPRTVTVYAREGVVKFSGSEWLEFDVGTAEQIAESLFSAAIVARRQSKPRQV